MKFCLVSIVPLHMDGLVRLPGDCVAFLWLDRGFHVAESMGGGIRFRVGKMENRKRKTWKGMAVEGCMGGCVRGVLRIIGNGSIEDNTDIEVDGYKPECTRVRPEIKQMGPLKKSYSNNNRLCNLA